MFVTRGLPGEGCRASHGLCVKIATAVAAHLSVAVEMHVKVLYEIARYLLP